MADCALQLQEAVQVAYDAGTSLNIIGGGSKEFCGGDRAGEPLDVGVHRGIVSYEPSELVLTASAGTQLKEIESLLASHGQMLGCEPPHFGAAATLGGAVACGFSGPRRPYAGALRDFVLGARIINGKGEILNFGGQVMKNVAGFDVSRLMVGAQGKLGVLLEVSLKVLPLPAYELTLRFLCSEPEAIADCAAWAGKPLAVSATAWLDGALYVRLSGSQVAVKAAAQSMGGEIVLQGSDFWLGLREQTHAFFHLEPTQRLWRFSLPPGTPPLNMEGRTCFEWGGAQRWVVSNAAPDSVHNAALGAGGYAALFRGAGQERIRLPSGVAALQERIKQAFDPAGILNVGGG
jgi:glycolate oxidase FAD binding subunit